MEIKINSNPVEVAEGATLAEVLKANNIEPTGKAVAVNGAVVKKAGYDTHIINPGDDIIIIRAFYGG